MPASRSTSAVRLGPTLVLAALGFLAVSALPALGQQPWQNVSDGWEMLVAGDTVGRSDWSEVSMDASWSELGLMGYGGPVWFRRRVSFDPAGVSTGLSSQIGASRAAVENGEAHSPRIEST